VTHNCRLKNYIAIARYNLNTAQMLAFACIWCHITLRNVWCQCRVSIFKTTRTIWGVFFNGDHIMGFKFSHNVRNNGCWCWIDNLKATARSGYSIFLISRITSEMRRCAIVFIFGVCHFLYERKKNCHVRKIDFNEAVFTHMTKCVKKTI